MPSLAPALVAGLAGFGLQEVWRVNSWPLLAIETGAVMLLYSVPLVLLSFPLRRSWALVRETFALTFPPRQPVPGVSTAGPVKE
jgi:hypothetical protein